MKSLLFLLLAITLSLHAEDFPDFPHIVTSGIAKQMVENDKAQIHVSVRSPAATAAKAQQMTAETINKIAETVKADTATEKMQTVGVQTNPVYAQSQQTAPRVVGYESRAGLQITANAQAAALLYAKLGEMQPTWDGSGITVTLSGPNFFLSPEKSAETEKGLIAAAYASAIAQAQALAKAAGLKIDKPVRLSTSQSYSAPSNNMSRNATPMAAMAMDSVAPIETQSGESQIGRSVEAIFSVQ